MRSAPADIKGAEIVLFATRAQQNPRDQKPGKDEEQVYARPAKIDRPDEDHVSGQIAGQMKEQDEHDGESAQAIQFGKVAERSWFLQGGILRGHGNLHRRMRTLRF